MRTIERDIVSTIILSKDGKMLLAYKSEGGVYQGTWVIFGGGIEEGEDKITALNREILEESGIDISKYTPELVEVANGESEKTLKETGERVFVKMKFFDYKVVIDDLDASQIKVTLDDEHKDYKWFEISDLKDIKVSPPTHDLFKKLNYI